MWDTQIMAPPPPGAQDRAVTCDMKFTDHEGSKYMSSMVIVWQLILYELLHWYLCAVCNICSNSLITGQVSPLSLSSTKFQVKMLSCQRVVEDQNQRLMKIQYHTWYCKLYLTNTIVIIIERNKCFLPSISLILPWKWYHGVQHTGRRKMKLARRSEYYILWLF